MFVVPAGLVTTLLRLLHATALLYILPCNSASSSCINVHKGDGSQLWWCIIHHGANTHSRRRSNKKFLLCPLKYKRYDFIHLIDDFGG